MTQFDDWKRCNELYCDWMYYEAAESGYNARAAAAAQAPYLKAITEYHETYGEYFNPHQEPETSITEDAADLVGFCTSFLADAEEQKAYGRKVSAWLDECRERAKKAREGVI